MLQAGRKNDAIVTVLQDNIHRQLTIVDLNRAAESLIGYSKEEIINQPLSTILSPEIQESIKDYLDFADPGSDLGSVLSKCRKCSIINQSGYNIPVTLKTFYGISQRDTLTFEILFRDITLYEKIETFRDSLVEQRINFENTSSTGIPNQQDFLGSLQLVSDFVFQHHVDAVFGLLAIDHMEMYGTLSVDEMHHLMGRVIDHVRKRCRQEDLIGYVDQNRLGIILFDCNAANAQKVFERIQEFLQFDTGIMYEGESQILHTSIGYQQIRRGDSTQQILAACDKTLNVIQFQGGGQVRETLAPKYNVADISEAT